MNDSWSFDGECDAIEEYKKQDEVIEPALVDQIAAEASNGILQTEEVQRMLMTSSETAGKVDLCLEGCPTGFQCRKGK